jgi:hypothetical protein
VINQAYSSQGPGHSDSSETPNSTRRGALASGHSTSHTNRLPPCISLHSSLNECYRGMTDSMQHDSNTLASSYLRLTRPIPNNSLLLITPNCPTSIYFLRCWYVCCWFSIYYLRSLFTKEPIYSVNASQLVLRQDSSRPDHVCLVYADRNLVRLSGSPRTVNAVGHTPALSSLRPARS